MKSFKRDKEKEKFKNESAEFKQKVLLHLYMPDYKCKITFTCHWQKSSEACRWPVFIFYLCGKEKKITTIELKFLYFQRNLDVNNIVNLDRKKPKKLTKDTKGN